MKIKEIVREMDTATASAPPREFKVTRATPQGVEVTDIKDPNTKMTVNQTALVPDKTDPSKLTLDPNVLAKADTGSQQAGVPVGTSVNVATAVPGSITPTSSSTETMGTETTMAENFDEITPKAARYILRKLDAGMYISDMIGDFPELQRMYDEAVSLHNLHPDDDFEKIEQVIINDLNNIADDEDDELSEIARLSGL